MRFGKLLTFGALVLAMGSASAATWMIGDNDGYGAGVPDNADHPFDGVLANYDGRSAAEMVATDGAQFTDTYSTTHPGYSPQPGTVATFTFTGLGLGWTVGTLEIDMADFQASTFGAVKVDYNGIVQDWAFNDGFPHTKIRTFDLSADVIDSINASGQLVITIDRNASSDFYGFDYVKLVDTVPEPENYAMMGVGLGLLALLRRRQARR